MENVDIKFQSLKNQTGGGSGSQNYNVTNNLSGLDVDDLSKKLQEMAKKLDTLKYDFDRMKEDTSYKFNELGKAMNAKADREDMLEGDRILHERIDNLEKALAKAKSDLKKAI